MPVVCAFGSSAKWGMPWHAKRRWFKSFVLNKTDTCVLTGWEGETQSVSSFLKKGEKVKATSEAVYCRPTGFLPVRFVAHCSASFGDETETNVHLETETISEYLKNTAQETAWKAKRRALGVVEKIDYAKMRRKFWREFPVRFSQIPPEGNEEKLSISRCPKCSRQIILEKFDHELQDKYDSNMIVWLEGQYMFTHGHPTDEEDLERSADTILIEHLKTCEGTGIIDMELRYHPRSGEDHPERFTASRNPKTGELAAECTECDMVFLSDRYATLYSAQKWSDGHIC